MEFQSVQYSIDTIVQRIRTSRLALPDFQREFVWNPSRVVELLDSVARQWPIGSLLLLSGPQPFAIREIDSAPKVSGSQLDLYILDGQQRVTSLYHATTDTSDFCYFIDFAALSAGEDDYISWDRREKFNRQYPTIEHRAKANIALIREIWDLQSFYSWLEHIEDSFRKIDFVSLRERRLGGLQAKVYKVMAIELDQEIDLEALARIFETLNRTGVRLNAFDLMVAALYPSGFRLRDEWESALNSHPIIRKTNPDAIEVLKLISLLVRANSGKQASAGVRQGDLLRIDRTAIRQTWPKALDLYVKALHYCQENFGITCEETVPSWSMILGVAGWLNLETSADIIRNWWITRLVEQYFGQAANTRIVSDFELISNHLHTPIIIPTSLQLDIMDEPSKRNGLLNRGLGGLLIHSGALDLISGQPLKNEGKIFFRAINSHGVVKRLSSTDNLNSTIIVSEETDRMIGKEKSLKNLGQNVEPALRSQGISTSIYTRETSFLVKLLDIPKGAKN